MAVTVSVLGSSSSGNCTFIATSRVKLLVDVGFSRTQIAKRLVAIGEALEDIDALIISHEHSDHVKGLASLLKKYDILTFVGEATYESLSLQPVLKKRESIRPGESFQVGDLKISPFSIPHDAADPVAFTLEAEGLKISHVMDLGVITELARYRMEASDVLVLESNHDLEMLRLSSYPWAVKQRIMGRHGHLSNESVGKFFEEDFDGKAGNILLAHLSENNNHPDLARMVARKALEKARERRETVSEASAPAAARNDSRNGRNAERSNDRNNDRSNDGRGNERDDNRKDSRRRNDNASRNNDGESRNSGNDSRGNDADSSSQNDGRSNADHVFPVFAPQLFAAFTLQVFFDFLENINHENGSNPVTIKRATCPLI